MVLHDLSPRHHWAERTVKLPMEGPKHASPCRDPSDAALRSNLSSNPGSTIQCLPRSCSTRPLLNIIIVRTLSSFLLKFQPLSPSLSLQPSSQQSTYRHVGTTRFSMLHVKHPDNPMPAPSRASKTSMLARYSRWFVLPDALYQQHRS